MKKLGKTPKNPLKVRTITKNKRKVYILPYPIYNMTQKEIITKKECKYCGKIIASLYPKQAEANLLMHEQFCKKKKEIKK